MCLKWLIVLLVRGLKLSFARVGKSSTMQLGIPACLYTLFGRTKTLNRTLKALAEHIQLTVLLN